MRFAEIIGNSALKESLVKTVAAGRLGHAILISEGESGGGFAFATALAQYVNCSNPSDGDSCGVCPSCHKYRKLIHPDLHFAFPVSSSPKLSDSENKAPVSDYYIREFKELALANPYFTETGLYDAIGIEKKNSFITVAEAKRIFEKLSLKAAEAPYKTMIIYLPEKMNADAANKLLKLLEEPPAGTLFLLVSQNPERLLQTIRSRCQLISVKPLTREERAAAGRDVQDNSEMREILVSILEAGLSKRLIETFPQWEMIAELGREKQRSFCLYCESFIRKLFLVANGMEQIADLAPGEESRVRDLVSRINPAFYEKAYTCFENALTAIASNVNAKLTFCDLCNRLFLIL